MCACLSGKDNNSERASGHLMLWPEKCYFLCGLGLMA